MVRGRSITRSRASSRRTGPDRRSVSTRVPMRPTPSSSSIIFSTARISTRSEEHTSELQSLMRISYAVFCLKKKNNIFFQLMQNRHENLPIRTDDRQHVGNRLTRNQNDSIQSTNASYT